MISNLRISLAELIVWALLAMAGLAWTVARVFDGLERAWEWLRRDRVAPLLEDDEARWAYPDDGLDDELPPLPPERTWEQMTSHQLPLTGPAERKAWQRLEKARWVRAAAAEVQQRQAYAALDLDYPSGLLARVREAAP